MDRLRLTMVKREEAAKLALLCLNPIEGRPTHDLIVGTGVMLAALCTKYGLNERDILQYAYRILNPEPFDKKANQNLEGLLDWVGLERAEERQRQEWGIIS